MRVLLIDTAGAPGSVLLAEGSPLTSAGERSLAPRAISTELIPAVRDLLAGWTLQDLDGFAVVSGPGSFTGLRIGLSAVKAMAEVTGKPIVALSRLAFLASAAGDSNSPVHAILDAGRNEFYHGVYSDSGRTRIEESLQSMAGIQRKMNDLPGHAAVHGPTVYEKIKSFTFNKITKVDKVSLEDALPLLTDAWQRQSFADPAELDANYLRRMYVVAPAASGAATAPDQP